MSAYTTQPRTITQPNYFRPARNDGATTIEPGYILKRGNTVDEVELASAATDAFCGVSVEDIEQDQTRSMQVDGKVAVVAGGSISIGDRLTSDANGKAIAATANTQTTLGYAVTAASASEWVEVELSQLGGLLFYANVSVADKAALKALSAELRNGLMAIVMDDRSLWVYDTSVDVSADEAEELQIEPTAGSGTWLRVDKSFVAKIPISYANTDGEAVWTIPESWALRLTGMPYWEVTTGFTGGSSSAIGISTNITGYTTGGDILGGASGDVAATLVAGIATGTIGGELDDTAGLHDLLLEEDSELQYDRITSAFTAGADYVCVPVAVAKAPATP